MDKKLFDFYYEILSHYFGFPEVADTLKDIGSGLDYLRNYPQNDFEFQWKKNKIIEYILKARKDNIIYQCQKGQKILPPTMSAVLGKTLYQDDLNELRMQLENEIIVLTLKGLHQAIKRYRPELDVNSLSEELLCMDMSTLQKYGLQ